MLLTRYGYEVSEKHLKLHKISDMAMIIVVFMSVCSRGSRSFCINNANSEDEVKLCIVMDHNLFQKVESMFMDIKYSEYGNGDYLSKTLSQVHFTKKSYFAEHPLKRNY